MKFTVFLTQRCNMACPYCYIKKGGVDIDEETATRAVDLAFELVPEGESLDFGFFGGEPTLRFDLIKKVTEEVSKKGREYGVETVVSLTSNGTIMNSDVLRFLKNEGIAYCVSLDGPPEVHDRYRVFGDGNGSSRTVVENLNRAIKELPSVSVNAVFGPETLDYLPTTVDYLLSFGVPVHLNRDIVTPWSEENLERVEHIFQRVAEIYVGYFENRATPILHPFEDKIMLFMVGGYSDGDKCRIGEGEWAVTVNGDVYPCERLAEDARTAGLVMGNVETGVDEIKSRAVIENRGNRNDECTDCAVKDFCVNWCGCTNWFMTGRTNYAGPATCRIERALIKAAKSALNALKENSHFHKYLADVFAKGCSNCNKEVRYGRRY